MKFLQVGLGSMGKRRVRCVHALRAGETVGFDVHADRRAEAESLYGIRTVASFEEGMAGDPDAIIISTPPHQHVEFALAAIAAGKPFFAEETVTLDPEAVTPLLAALARQPVVAAPVVAAPSCTMRFHPAVRQIQRILQSGDLGRPLSFDAMSVSYLPDWHPWSASRNSTWRAGSAAAAGRWRSSTWIGWNGSSGISRR